MGYLRRLFTPPVFDNEERTQRARMFHTVVITAMGLVTPLMIIFAALTPTQRWRAAVALVTVDVVGPILLAVSRSGRTRLASMLLIAAILGVVTALSLTAGGIRSPGVTMYFIFVMMAGVLLGERSAMITAVVAATLGLSLVILELFGLLPDQTARFAPSTLWILNCLYMGIALTLLRLASNTVTGALKRVEAELAERRAAEAERDASERRRQGLEHQLRQSQKMEALGTLAGGIAHDFNNIIGAIIGNAQLGLMETDPTNAAYRTFADIERSGQRAADIVNRILMFSRRQDSERKVMWLEPVLDDALKLFRSSVPRNVTLQSTIESGLPPMVGDATQVYQIIVNLGTNAAHAIGETHGVIDLCLALVDVNDDNAELALQLAPGPYLRLTVQDSGSGMPKETLDRLFEPFFTTKGRGGSGLGLAMVHGIVRDHAGAVTVESEVGRGSTFRVYFPVARADAATKPAEPAPNTHGNGEHVLYVDDEEALVRVVERVLPRLGYRCTGFTNPADALERFRSAPDEFDAVITDVSMPGMSGYELASALRAVRPNVRIAAASGLSDSASANNANIAMLLRKPLTIEALARATATLLRTSVKEPVASASRS